MRRIVYAGGSFVTTHEVARTLLRLSIGVTAIGATELVEVPMAVVGADRTDTAELLVGPGVPILSLPAEWNGAEPDFSAEALMLQLRTSYPMPLSAESEPVDASDATTPPWTYDVDDW